MIFFLQAFSTSIFIDHVLPKGVQGSHASLVHEITLSHLLEFGSLVNDRKACVTVFQLSCLFDETSLLQKEIRKEAGKARSNTLPKPFISHHNAFGPTNHLPSCTSLFVEGLVLHHHRCTAMCIMVTWLIGKKLGREPRYTIIIVIPSTSRS